MNVLVQVTQDDIWRGRPCDIQACPVALAMTRVLGHRFEWVDLYFAQVDGRPVSIPQNASVFMEAIDYEDPVLPIEFTVNVPDPEPAEDAP